MSKCLIVMVCVSLLVSGCRTPPMPAIDAYVADVASHPFDVAPTSAVKPGERTPARGRPGDAPPAGRARQIPAPPGQPLTPLRRPRPRRRFKVCRQGSQRSPTTSLEPPLPRLTDSPRHQKEIDEMTKSFGPP